MDAELAQAARVAPTETGEWAVRSSDGAFALMASDRSVHAPSAGRVFVRLLVGGICGTDVGMLRAGTGTAGQPGGPLHEIVGVVLDGGAGDFDPGTTVVGWAGDYRGLRSVVECDPRQLAAVPRALEHHPELAIVAQPLACVLYALERVGPLTGRSVLVLGAGSVGLLFAAEASRAGATVTVVDREARSDLAARYGAVQFAQADARDPGLLHGRLFDVVIEAIGHDADVQAGAGRFLKIGGTLYLFGVPDEASLTLPFGSLFYCNARILTGITLEHRRHLEAALAELLSGRYASGYVTDIYPVSAAQAAFDRAQTDDPTRIKVLIDARDHIR